MSPGEHWRLTPQLIAQGVVCIILLCLCAYVVANIDKSPGSLVVIAQVGLALVGAWFGSLIPKAMVPEALVSKASASIRQLIDHAAALGGMTTMIDGYRHNLGESSSTSTLAPEVVSAWLLTLDEQTRGAIRETETAVDNWNDLAPGVSTKQLAEYQERHGRLTDIATAQVSTVKAGQS